LTKSKERQADWQRYKFDLYKELVQSLSGIVGADASPDGNRRLAASSNTVHLIASIGVLNALHEYQDETFPIPIDPTLDTMSCCPACCGRYGKTCVFHTTRDLTSYPLVYGVQALLRTAHSI
jgi:hypothetical protein